MIRHAINVLVQSSVWVSCGCGALGAWASLATRGKIDGVGLVSMIVFLFQTYTLDRYIAHPEDRHDNACEIDPAAFVSRYRSFFRIALVFSVIVQIALVSVRPRLVAILAVLCMLTLSYMVRLPLLGKRLKEVPFLKNIYAPAMGTLYIITFMGLPLTRESAPLLFAVYFLIQINAITFDMKDIDNDRRAGLRLISTELSPRVVYALLVGCSLAGAMLFFFILPRPWNVQIAVTFLGMAWCIQRLARDFSLLLLFAGLDGLLAAPLLLTTLSSVSF